MNNEKVGIVAAENLVIKDPKHKKQFTKEVAKTFNIKINEDYHYVAGTCFAIKSKLLEKMKQLNLSLDDFDNKIGSFSVAHGMERIICAFIEPMGYEIRGVKTYHRKYERELLLDNKYDAIRLLDDPRFCIDYDFFYKSLELRRIKDYAIKKIKLSEINRKWFDGNIYKLEDCAPYQYLVNRDKKQYNEYCNENAKYSKFMMNIERFENLIKSMDEGINNKCVPVLYDESYIIADGQHRLCYLLYKYGKEYETECLCISC